MTFPAFAIERHPNGSLFTATIPRRCAHRAVIMHAVDQYTFLLPEAKREYDAKEFARLIRDYSHHPRVQAIADAVEHVDEMSTL